MGSLAASGVDEQKQLPAAELKIVDCKALQKGDETECKRLFDVCCTDGFFYLDINGMQNGIFESVDRIYALEKELFDLPENVLMKYDIDKQSPQKLNGYVQV